MAGIACLTLLINGTTDGVIVKILDVDRSSAAARVFCQFNVGPTLGLFVANDSRIESITLRVLEFYFILLLVLHY